MWTFCSSYLTVNYCNFSPEANRRMAHREAGDIHCWSAEQKNCILLSLALVLIEETYSECPPHLTAALQARDEACAAVHVAKPMLKLLLDSSLPCDAGYVSTELFLASLICILLFLTSKTIHPTRMQDSKGGCPASEQHVPLKVLHAPQRRLLHPRQQPTSSALACHNTAQRLQPHQASIPSRWERVCSQSQRKEENQREGRSPPWTDRFITNTSYICTCQ